MKWKPIVLLPLVTAVGVGSLAATAGAGRGRITPLTADLTLRPGVGRAGHPAVAPHALYGALDATYNSRAGTLAYTLDYKGLKGPAFRVTVRSRATGSTYAVLCDPCHPVVLAKRGHEGLPVDHLSGRLPVDDDVGFLITHARTFVEVDTTAYPSGEIGAPMLPPPPELPFTGPPATGGTYAPAPYPRCC
jgi:hypothetical protein